MATIKLTQSEAPLIVIVGPTASGKSSVAMRLAQEFNGEIISADSRAIYKGLNVGTAKPTADDQKIVAHWGIDLVDPGQLFTVKDFQDYATNAIRDIRERGKVPVLVGGTGLYINAIVYGYTFNTTLSDSKRNEFDQMSFNDLYKYCSDNNIRLPENFKNKRYVVNAIIRGTIDGPVKQEVLENCYIVGITTDKELLRQRISDRADVIITSEVFKEAQIAAQKYGWQNEAMTGNVYRLLSHDSTVESFLAMKDKFITLDWQLAKRQLTWFRRSEHIEWRTYEDAYTYCARLLANWNNS